MFSRMSFQHEYEECFFICDCLCSLTELRESINTSCQYFSEETQMFHWWLVGDVELLSKSHFGD